MATSIRPSTLETLGLGSVHQIFQRGSLPTRTSELVDQVFGEPGDRGALVISGANGIVGAGKAMQLASRLLPYGVPIVALDFPGVPDGIGAQYPGLVRAFGPAGASRVMEQVIRLTYDGKDLPSLLGTYNPRFLLEAIPEILDIKKAHYEIFRASFPEIEIRSVTSGFPSSQLKVGIAHPAFPHEINKIWEMVEPKPSPITQLFWAVGMIPMPVSDDWSFVLDVLFCGLTLTGLRYHRATNMPFWKIDKYIRKHVGPNPFRAHDAIGAKGANFLTWSCLHHLSQHYGALFAPTPELDERQESGQNWYPLNHFRPLVNWTFESEDEEEFHSWILGPLFQMASLLLEEKRSHFSHVNAIGELCAQFKQGILALIRSHGPENTVRIVEAYHRLHPEAAKKCWYPAVFESMEDPSWQQLYVNAEHDGNVGVLTLSRESYNQDVNAELNRAMDWLKSEGIERVILTGDFHLSTQLVGADTSDFFPALEEEEKGYNIAHTWSQTARRLHTDFKVSVGFINGKRCLGGMLELLMHCHYLVSLEDADLGMPEVTLPVVPGMEGCHWPFRKADPKHWPELVKLLLEGRSIKAREASGWLVNFAGPMDEALKTAWKIATGGDHKLKVRKVVDGSLKNVPAAASGLRPADAAMEGARKAILTSIQESCSATLADALSIQAKHSAGFMTGKLCKKGAIGQAFTKTMLV
jgi:enoyl-CoA hydratase/carnithine racemase/3-hydroxyacyl-CoA dehydrogenase